MSSKTYRRWAAKQERRVNGRIGSMSRYQIIAFMMFVVAITAASLGWLNPTGLIPKIILTTVSVLMFLAGAVVIVNDPDWDKE